MADRRRWVRLDADVFHDPVVVALGDEHGASGPLVWLAVITAAKDGAGVAETTYAALGRSCYCSTRDAEAIVADLADAGWVTVEAGAGRAVAITVCRWREFQIDPSGAERKRAQRDRERSGVTVTDRDAGVTSVDPERMSRRDSRQRTEDIDPIQASPSRVPARMREAASGTTTIEDRWTIPGIGEVTLGDCQANPDGVAVLIGGALGGRFTGPQAAVVSRALLDAPAGTLRLVVKAQAATRPIGYLVENVRQGAHVDPNRALPTGRRDEDVEAEARRAKMRARMEARNGGGLGA